MLRKTPHPAARHIASPNHRRPPRWRDLSGLALTLALIGPGFAAPLPPLGTVRCGDLSGLNRARCERQRELHATCAEVAGDARPHCERCFIAAHSMRCESYTGLDRQQCDAEQDALSACSAGPVETFTPCLNAAVQGGPGRLTAQR